MKNCRNDNLSDLLFHFSEDVLFLEGILNIKISGLSMSEWVGRIIKNRYRMEAFLGQGGMADVYKVWDQDRSVYLALKLLRQDLALDRIFLRRFKREAQTLANLQHPNIVRFYDLEQDDLLLFILMEYIDGRSSKVDIFRLDGTPMHGKKVLEILHPVCRALHSAHKLGVVHCDINPANILMDKAGRVMVSDFGIARMSDAATATMIGMGTPAYMAPEQIRGLDPIPQTDIYSLGVILYEMLTGGERPFTGEKARTTGTTSEKVRWEQIYLKPPSPKEFSPNISPQLEEIVFRCLQKEYVKRYSNVLDLSDDLDQALSDSTTVESETARKIYSTPGTEESIQEQIPSPIKEHGLR